MKNILLEYVSNYITLTEDEENTIMSLNLIKIFKKGSVLLKQGQHSDKTYFVLKGCIRRYYLINGEEKTTDIYVEKESFTANCAIRGGVSECYVCCIEDSILVVSNPQTENMFFDKFPRFENLFRSLSEELLIKKQRLFDDFRMSSPEQRYLKLVEDRPDIIQRVPQQHLASYLGITPQSLSRIRKRLILQKV